MHDAEGEQAQGAGERDGAGPVDSGRIWVARFAHPRGTEQQHQGTDQGVDQEDGTPTESADQEAGPERAGGEADAKSRAQQAEGAGARRALELLRQHRGASRERQGAGNALNAAQQV